MNTLLACLVPLKLYAVECSLLMISFLLIIFDLLPTKKKGGWIVGLSGVGLAAILGYISFHGQTLIGKGFENFYTVTSLDLFLKAILILGALFTILILGSKKSENGKPQGELYILILLGTLGASFVASSGELITLFISLEILTISSYVLTAYAKQNKKATEAGVKYLILGSLSAALFLFGSALLYGITGTTKLELIHTALSQNISAPLLWVAFFMIFAGLAFKMGTVPFQFWIPDVYEGAPTWVGGFLSTVSKATGFIAFNKILLAVSGTGSPIAISLPFLMGILSILSVLYGNLGACLQTNVKRLLGYSSIAHAGYLFLALTNPEIFGWKAVAYYLFLYTFSNLLAFGVIFCINTETGDRKDLEGLKEKSPFLAACLFIGFASLAGIPPMAGFIGKFSLLLAAFKGGAYIAMGVAFLGILISIFYYYQVIRTAFSCPTGITREGNLKKISLSPLAYLTLGLLAIGVLFLGIYPAPLFRFLF